MQYKTGKRGKATQLRQRHLQEQKKTARTTTTTMKWRWNDVDDDENNTGIPVIINSKSKERHRAWGKWKISNGRPLMVQHSGQDGCSGEGMINTNERRTTPAKKND